MLSCYLSPDIVHTGGSLTDPQQVPAPHPMGVKCNCSVFGRDNLMSSLLGFHIWKMRVMALG